MKHKNLAKKMKSKITFKKTMSVLLLIITLCSSVYTTSKGALAAGGSGTAIGSLGTNSALNSPVLNSNFTANEWSKWEMVVWGIFLSNFTAPFLDTYQTAFSTNSSSGSKGAGLKNLEFGTGNDPSTNSVLAWLTSCAIKYQTTSCQDIYVCYTQSTGVMYKTIERKEAKDDTVRKAKFQDLFFLTGDEGNLKEEKSAADAKTMAYWGSGLDGWSQIKGGTAVAYKNTDNTGGYYLYTLNNYSIPTFYIKSKSNEYIPVLDFTNSVDVQQFSAVFNKVLTSGLADEIKSNFTKLWDANNELKLDSFGNLIDGKTGAMCFAGSCNQHLSKTDTVNILNSWIFSGYSSSESADSLITGARGLDINKSSIVKGSTTYHGFSAISGDNQDEENNIKMTSGQMLLYFDTDTIVPNKSLRNETYSYGNIIKDLMSQSLTNRSFNFKIDCYNEDIIKSGDKKASTGSKGIDNVAFTTSVAAQAIANFASTDSSTSILHEMILPNGTKQSLIDMDSAVLIPVDAAATSKASSDDYQYRYAANNMYKAFKGSDSFISTYYKPERVNSEILSKSTYSAFSSALHAFEAKLSSANSAYKNFKSSDGSACNDTEVLKYDKGDKSLLFNGTASVPYDDDISFLFNDARFILAYPINSVMLAVSNYFGANDGCDLSVYSTYIYSTYLNFYGIHTSNVSGANDESNLNTDIFVDGNSILSVDITDADGVKSEEQIEKENKELTHKMLSLDVSGKEYRKNWIKNFISGFLYSQYTKLAYGDSNNSYTTVASTSRDGFLSTQSYAENPITSWFFNIYEEVAMLAILVSLILIVAIMLFNRRKISWLITNIAIAITIILLVPSIGEIVPYFSNQAVEKLFTSNFTYWSIEEQANYQKRMEDSYAGLGSNAEAVQYLVNNLSQNYADATLLLKRDISGKVMQKLSDDYAKSIQLTSARWMLPTLMQQISAADKADENNYVYATEANMFNDCYNICLMYNKTYSSRQSTYQGSSASKESTAYSLSNTEKQEIYSEYEPTTYDADGRSYEIGDDKLYCRSLSYSLKSANTSDNVMVHNQFYLLRPTLLGDLPTYKGLLGDTKLDTTVKTSTAFSKYLAEQLQNSDNASKWETITTTLEKYSDEYNRENVSQMMGEYGYLFATESPLYYFYQAVNDCTTADVSKNGIIMDLEGQYENTVDNSGNANSSKVYSMGTNAKNEKIRNAPLMYATVNSTLTDESDGLSTGYTRDIVDLEELFTNTISYLYKMSMTANGDDSISGKVDGKIDKSLNSYYGGSDRSWLYKCNWAIKIIESPSDAKKCTVKDREGNKFTVENPMIPQCYPSHRPMVFSEAQQIAYGLKDSDLSIAELKCVEVNKQIAEKWTLLINYAGTSNLTAEVLVRQMALEATTIFCKEFSPSGIISGAYQLYPTSIDLRHLSFDALMKLIVVNNTNATISQSTNIMQSMIDDNNLLDGVLLLIITWLYARAFPLLKQIVMAFLLFIVLMRLVMTIMADRKTKFKVVGGTTLTNIVYLLINLGLYGAISLMIKVTNNDQVLNVNRISMKTGSLTASYILLILLAALYAIISFIFIKKTWQYRHDVGFSMYAQIGSAIGSRVSNSVGKVGKTLSGFNKNGGAAGLIGELKKHKKSDKQTSGNKSDATVDKELEWARNKLSNSDSSSQSESSSQSAGNSDKPEGRNYNQGNEPVENTSSAENIKDFVNEQMKEGEKNINKGKSDKNTEQNKDKA